MKKALLLFALIVVTATSFAANPKIYIAFQWHMHQPIYYPYESCTQTVAAKRYSFDIVATHTDRNGPYTSWPKNAVQKGIDASMAHFGAQVSFSGSLMENLNSIEAAGKGFTGWKANWTSIRAQKTSLGNPRIDMVGFGYHHPLMGLIDYTDIRKQIQLHKAAIAANFPGVAYSKGIFPPENAFSMREIPALVDEGLQWVLVDNFNFERAATNCPTGDGTGVLRPNQADIQNPDPNDWTALSGVYCPAPISAQWGHQPHYVSYTDPTTGLAKKIIAVPTSRYLGNEDGRGGFGALNYDNVMSQLASKNTDSNHPIILVLHHDGDNYGGGTDSYYGSNFAQFVSWLQANSDRFECTTVQDYLDRFPPAATDLIQIQDGSWVGADSGDPQFKKWNGDPGKYTAATGNYSPDRNSWGVMTAAKNIMETAEQINPTAQGTLDGWKYYLNGQTSCYWYWDGTEIWDSNPARAAVLAVNAALSTAKSGTDATPPSLYVPQRIPYNPGGIEWDSQFKTEGYKPTDFSVWTYVYDMSGLQSVNLKYRISASTKITQDNLTFAGGSTVGSWTSVVMTPTSITSITNPVPTYKADEYSGSITGVKNKMVDYYVEATDAKGNVKKSDILHVWVANGSAVNPDAPSLIVTPAGGTYIGGTTVTLTSSGGTAPVDIYYTTDGSTPTAASTKYTNSISVSINGTQIKAIAIGSDKLASAVASHVYITDANTKGITIRFLKPASWTSAKLYAWYYTGTVKTEPCGGWSGTAMTKEGATEWYSYTFSPTITKVSMVITNGSGIQTSDILDVQTSTCYEFTSAGAAPKVVTCPISTSLNKNDLPEEALQLFPNPMTNGTTLVIESLTNENFIINLHSLEGRIVFRDQFNSSSNYTLSRNYLPAGIYFLEVVGIDSGRKAVRKLVIY